MYLPLILTFRGIKIVKQVLPTDVKKFILKKISINDKNCMFDFCFL